MLPNPRFFRTRGELRAWFERYHVNTRELWIGFHKAHSGRAGVGYPEAVEEALGFGWIDTTVRRIDADRYAHRFTPRRPDSYWSVVNRQKFVELERAGRVHESGRRAFDRRPPGERLRYSSELTLRLAPTFAVGLRAAPETERYFRSRPRGYRRRATFWVMNAARPETRERRFEMLLNASSVGTVPTALLLPGEPAPRPVRHRAPLTDAVRPRQPRRRQSRPSRR